MTTPINRAFMRLARRAERQDREALVRTFVEAGPLFTLLSRPDHQILFGRRGTGKTHALAFLEQETRRSSTFVCYVDLRLIGSNQSIYSDDSLSVADRATRLILDVLAAIRDVLVSTALEAEDIDDRVLTRLDQLAAAITEVVVLGEVEVETEGRVSTQRTEESAVSASLEGASASFGRRGASSEELRGRVHRRGAEKARINFGAVGGTLGRVVESLPNESLWILLDEWSVVPLSLQPILADLLRRAVFPLGGVVVKIAAIEQRSNFRVPSVEGGYVGIELGADAAADANLDDFMVFGNDSNKAFEFFRDLLHKHVLGLLEEGGEDGSIAAPGRFVQNAFTQANVLVELVRAAEGVPRDAINIASGAAQRADDGQISMANVRDAARTWFERDKESPIPARAKALLHWIIDKVIGERRARAFLLEQGKAAAHPLVAELFDLRVLHVLRRGVSARDTPGVRYDVYGIDYGAYVQLTNTAQAPNKLFIGQVESHVDEPVEVPIDDYRSIRRAILDLDDFDKAHPAEAP